MRASAHAGPCAPRSFFSNALACRIVYAADSPARTMPCSHPRSCAASFGACFRFLRSPSQQSPVRACRNRKMFPVRLLARTCSNLACGCRPDCRRDCALRYESTAARRVGILAGRVRGGKRKPVCGREAMLSETPASPLCLGQSASASPEPVRATQLQGRQRGWPTCDQLGMQVRQRRSAGDTPSCAHCPHERRTVRRPAFVSRVVPVTARAEHAAEHVQACSVINIAICIA
jgi:hypothetical protein